MDLPRRTSSGVISIPVFQCNGCPSGPCILTNMDPELEAGSGCIKDGIFTKANTAVWRELVVAE